ncbi:MAG: class I SAM-dependent methyltransferase [Acidobacteriota bacterium]
MRADYGERYRELYNHHWWWRAREGFVLGIIRAKQPPQGWKRILDVGCGDGLFFDQLAKFGDVEGVEPAEGLVSKRGPYRAHIHTVPFDGNFQPGKQFSLILMLDVLEHLNDPVGALRHALALLEPRGTVLVTVPAFNLLWTNHDLINEHVARYTRRRFRGLARQAGMEIKFDQYFFHWAFPAKLVTRLGEWVLGRKPVPPAVPSPAINRLLYRLSCFEQKTWGRLPIPFGSSYVAMGRKSTNETIEQGRESSRKQTEN